MGLAVLAISLWASPEMTGRFSCTWSEPQCTATRGGVERKLELASLQRVNVSNSRTSGNSLELVTANGYEVLADATLHPVSRTEYYAAATGINALLRHRTDSVDVSFTYRPGSMPGLLLMGVGLLSSFLGARALWGQRRTRSEP